MRLKPNCSQLFRSEVVTALRISWLGKPQLSQPVSVVMATGMAVLMVAVITSIMVFGTYTRRVRVHGAVVPSGGAIHIFAPRTGRILSSMDENVPIKIGDRLATIGTDTTSASGETELVVKDQLLQQIAELEKAIVRRRHLNQVEKQGLEDQHRAVAQELLHIKPQLEQTEEYLSVLKSRSDKYRKLISQGIAVERTFETAQESFMQVRQEATSLQRQRTQLEGRLAEISTKLAGFDASADLASGELRQRIATMKEQLAQSEARRSIVVTAPVGGTVAAVFSHVGQIVAAGSPLLSILPEGKNMEVHLLAESRSIGFVREGQSVMLRYAGYPYQKFGQYPGVVTNVSRVTLRQEEAELDALAAQPKPGAALYRITVVPNHPTINAYGKVETLRAGMRVEADIFLDTRALYQWVLEPFYSLRGRAA